MANLFKLECGKYNALMGKLAEAGMTAEMAEEVLTNPNLARRMIGALQPQTVGDLPVWQTITVGGKSKDEFLEALESGGFKVTEWAKDMMAKKGFVITPEPTELDLVKVTVRDLGFPEGATTRELWSRIRERGGRLCPPDTGPALRLAYGDQPDGEYLWVAMEQITDSGGYPGVFRVFHDGDERWLDSDDADSDGGWYPGRCIVFVGPRK